MDITSHVYQRSVESADNITRVIGKCHQKQGNNNFASFSPIGQFRKFFVLIHFKEFESLFVQDLINPIGKTY